MRSFVPNGPLPEGCEINGIATFVTFIDKDQNEYLVPLGEVPESDELKEVVLRNEIYAQLKEVDYEMARRILNTIGECLV